MKKERRDTLLDTAGFDFDTGPEGAKFKGQEAEVEYKPAYNRRKASSGAQGSVGLIIKTHQSCQ